MKQDRKEIGHHLQHQLKFLKLFELHWSCWWKIWKLNLEWTSTATAVQRCWLRMMMDNCGKTPFLCKNIKQKITLLLDVFLLISDTNSFVIWVFISKPILDCSSKSQSGFLSNDSHSFGESWFTFTLKLSISCQFKCSNREIQAVLHLLYFMFSLNRKMTVFGKRLLGN